MIINRRLILVLSIALLSIGFAQPNKRVPHIGYIYPAGGKQGTTVKVMAGGQYLRNTEKVFITGKGIEGKVIEFVKPLRKIEPEERRTLKKEMIELTREKVTEMRQEGNKKKRSLKKNRKTVIKNSENKKQKDKETTELPEHPMIEDLKDKSLEELGHLNYYFFTSRKKGQRNRQLDETLFIEINIKNNVKPGNYELRIQSPQGLSNPIVFQVGQLPEIREIEPNNKDAEPKFRRFLQSDEEKALETPFIMNGRIMPGDIDRFEFKAEKSQKLVIRLQARSLMPYLADAVPGWFQAVAAIYESNGTELKFTDDYRFHPDPVMLFEVPETGSYQLEIRDAVYRGRDDFVYRLSVGELPFITEIFPLGGKAGEKTPVYIKGWNIERKRILIDTRPGDKYIRQISHNNGRWISNSVAYAVDPIYDIFEKESNDTIQNAQKIGLPKIINGRITKSDDIDIVQFKGRKKQKIVAEVLARRLNSPLDSYLEITDSKGNVIAYNDDYVEKDQHLHKDIQGLVTHHADSYVTAELPEDGTYYIHLKDAQCHGSQAHSYRLRISYPEPDFALRVTPSSLMFRRGEIVPVNVHALRKDGFNGAINIKLKDDTHGFQLEGNTIPPDCGKVQMTIKAPDKSPGKSIVLQLEGTADIGGRKVTHKVVPAENRMQAFLYRHLVPSRVLMAYVKDTRWRNPQFRIAGPKAVRINAGNSDKIKVVCPNKRILKDIKLQLHDPPMGFKIIDVNTLPKGLEFKIHTDPDIPEFKGNLIVEAYRKFTPKAEKGEAPKKKRTVYLGAFPAIEVEKLN